MLANNWKSIYHFSYFLFDILHLYNGDLMEICWAHFWGAVVLVLFLSTQCTGVCIYLLESSVLSVFLLLA